MLESTALHVRAAAERSGDDVRLVLTVTLPDGVHVEPHEPTDPYLIPTVVTAEGLEEVTVVYPPPGVKDLGWNGATLSVLEGSLEFAVVGRIASGITRLCGTLTYQPCIGGACLPPRSVTWEAPVSGVTEYSILHALTA